MLKFIICVLIFVVLFPVSITAQEKDDVSSEKVKPLIEKLKSKFREDRETAKQDLIKIGPKVEPFILKALNEDSEKVKKYSIEILKHFKLESSIKPLLEQLIKLEADSSLIEDITEALISFIEHSKKIYKILEEIKNREDVKKNKVALKNIDQFLGKFCGVFVESHFRKIIREIGPFLVYEGIFDELKYEKRYTTKILKDILSNKYKFTLFQGAETTYIRYLVGEALISLIEPSDKELVEFFKNFVNDVEIEEIAAFGLWKLGEKSFYEKLIKREEENKNSPLLPYLYSRIGELEKAEKLYVNLLSNPPSQIKDKLGYFYYNLACIEAKLNNKKEAIEYLKKAVKEKCREVNLYKVISLDKELDNIRGEDEFSEILKEAKKISKNWE